MRDLLSRIDTRGRLHLVGVAIGGVAAAWAATPGDWAFALVLGGATLVIGLGVVRRIQQAQREP
jgi:pyridoxal biosynthesis lyase PdxS